METKAGDVLKVTAIDAIVNSAKAQRLSQAIGDRYHWDDPYRIRRPKGKRNLAVREDRAVPGSIQIMKNHTGNTFDVSYSMGFRDRTVKRIPTQEDSGALHEKRFKECLEALGALPDYQNLAFPYGIGCGLAGGNWTHFEQFIREFAVRFHKHVNLWNKKYTV